MCQGSEAEGSRAGEGGVDGRTEATGRGIFFALRAFFNSADVKKTKIKGPLKSQKIIIEGLGKVGFFAARALSEHGSKIVGIIEKNVSFHNAKGLNVQGIKDWLDKKSLSKYQKRILAVYYTHLTLPTKSIV